MGIPVVISDNGIPVVDVTGTGVGVLMTVAENGFGTPVTIADNGFGLAAVFDPPLGPLPPPMFTTGTTVSRIEGVALGWAVSTTPSSTKAITGGANAANFVLVSGAILAPGHVLNWVSNTAQTPGDYIVQITATNAAGSANQTITVTVTEAPTPPNNELAPLVTGTPAEGQTLTCDKRTWSGSAPITYEYQWYRITPPVAGDVLTDFDDEALTDFDDEVLTGFEGKFS